MNTIARARAFSLALLFLPLLAIAGCGTIGSVLNGSVSNPVTPNRAATLHAAFYAGVLAASADYAGLPRCPAAQPCSDQKVVGQLRTYVNGAEASLTRLDGWALGNTSLNGPALYQAALLAVTTAQSFALGNGVAFTPAEQRNLVQ